MKTNLTTNQFLSLLAINVAIVLFGIFQYNNIPFKKVVQHDTKTVYKDKIVNRCVATDEQVRLIQEATDQCDKGNSQGLQKFSMDSNNRPVITCKTQ